MTVPAVARAAAVAVTRTPGAAPDALLEEALARLDLPAGAPVALLVAGADVSPVLLARLAGLLGDSTDALAGPRAAGLPEGSDLHGVELPVAWQDAALRVLVTGASTDVLEGYVGGCAALGRLLPEDCAVPAPGAVVELLRHVPPHLVVVDATRASDGCFGSVRPAWRQTGTVLAGTDALAVDECLATLMGVDPGQSAVVACAVAELGLPVPRRVDGSLVPWEGWRQVPPELLGACRRATATVPSLGRLLQAVAGDAPAADDDPVLREARRWGAGLVDAVDDQPAALAALVAMVESVAGWGAGARAWSTVLAKSRVPRHQVSLGLDLGAYTGADYDEVAEYLAPLADLAAQAPLRPGGLRWRRYGGGVLFSVERELDAPYDAFVARVDLARAIRLMNDYVGGTAVVVARDDAGRVLRQAERNLYLPQPNYVAFAGGECIDVCKLEVLRYEEGRSSISWRTVRSPNGTAVHDDGRVTFAARGPERTLVTVAGLQEFVLPPFWQAVELDRYPALYDALTDDAYRRFFTATLDRFEACYEGRDEPVGRPVVHDPEPPTARWSRALQVAGAALRELSAAPSQVAGPVEVDEDGFRHIPGGVVARPRVELAGRGSSSARWSGLAQGLAEAVQRDLSRQRSG